MKKLLLLFACMSIFTLSSFETNPSSTLKVELVRWNYTCGGSGATGSYLMPAGSTQAQALAVAVHICGG